MAHFVETYGRGPQRVQLEIKDPRGFEEYLRHFKEHSALGARNTLLGVQCRRPSFYDLTAEMSRMDVPALIMAGDEEEPCLEVNLLMKRAIPNAALAILPRSGHAINLEEPELFNRLLEDFLRQVESGRCAPRDPRSTIPSIYGPSGKP
jgi:pimeloyl-ACP methyl ester carboxylesterase